jgi:hypothetical protein
VTKRVPDVGVDVDVDVVFAFVFVDVPFPEALEALEAYDLVLGLAFDVNVDVDLVRVMLTSPTPRAGCFCPGIFAVFLVI